MNFRRVRIISGNKDVIYDGLIYALPIKEKVIQCKCMEIYKEFCVCKKRIEIIRGQLYITLDDYFKQFEDGAIVPMEYISDDIWTILDFPETMSKKEQGVLQNPK